MSDSSIINIIDESGFQSNSNSIAFLGTKTNAKDHYQFRFSQDLPPKSLFRTSLIPNKRRITIPQKVIQKNAKELENSHMNTSLLPNTSTKTNNPKIKLRSPYMSQGHNLRQTFPSNSTYGNAKRSQSSIDPNPFHKLRFSTTKKEEKHKKPQPALKPIDKESKLASTQSALEMIFYPLQSKKNTNRRLLLNLPENEPQLSKPSKAEDSHFPIECDKRFKSIEIQNMAPHIQRNKKADNSDSKTSEQSQDHSNEQKEAENGTKEQLTPIHQQVEISNENKEDPKVEQSLNENEVNQTNEKDQKTEETFNEESKTEKLTKQETT